MKIIFISPSFHNNQCNWVKTLLNKGHEVYYFVWYELGNKSESLETETIEKYNFLEKFSSFFHNFKLIKLFLSIPKPILFYKKIKENNPDIVIIRNPFRYTFSFFALCFSRLQGRRIIFYSQTDLYKKVGKLRFLFIKFVCIFFKAKWITPLKGSPETFYSKFYKDSFYVPFSIDFSDIFTKKNGNNEPIKIISVGKFSQERKNNLLLLRAIKKLKDIKDLKLTIVGALYSKDDLTYRKIVKYIKDNNLQNKVIIKINLPYKEMFAEYSKHHLFILPSSNEPASYSVLEAMSCGLPVVCSDTNGTKYYIEEGENGYIFKSDNLEDLSDKIRLIISNREKMKKMKKESLRIVKEKYSPEVFYEKFMKVLVSEKK